MCRRRLLSLIRPAAPLGVAAALLLGGCSTPKHSNVLIFGTNTRVAFDVSYDPKTQEPGILLGYKRQEAVWMPLLANLADSSGTARAPTAAELSADKSLLYIGRDGPEKARKTDTYSVLASFGAKFEGKAKGAGTSPELSSSAGLAQFFATGLAARALAERGGEALVSVQNSAAPAQARAAEAEAEKARAETERAQISADFAKFQDEQRNTGASRQAEAEKLLATAADDAVPALLKAAQDAKLITDAEVTAAVKPAEQRRTLLKAFNVGPDADANAALAAFLAKTR